MQNVAAEMNLSETASFSPRAGGADGFDLRWFTPTIEVPLCGHATLANANALWESGTLLRTETATFHALSGELKACHSADQIELDFPAIATEAAELPQELTEALGSAPARYVGLTPQRSSKDRDFPVELDSVDTVRNAPPDFSILKRGVPAGVIITAQSSGSPFDFVSRYFAVYAGIDEDPVTGTAHCALMPYWSERLGKTEVTGYQASRRGGVVGVRLGQGRVYLLGGTVSVLDGKLLH
jgi:PhzF family phenazine biosynthesis protein